MYKATQNLIKTCLHKLKQPSLVGVGEWANKYRSLDSTSAKEIGKFAVERTPYMLEIYEKIADGETKQFTLMMASQLAKSELIINIIGRYAHLDPCPMLVVQPTDEMARSFSKERVQTAINNCEVLKELIKEPGKRDSGNTVTHKMFPGGFIAFVGATSPSKLAARPIRIIFLDEVDRYPKSSGDEGSPISLAKKRTTTFDDITKHIITGTPTIKGASEVEDEYINSSMGEWYIPCPKCGTYQTYKWTNIKWDSGITDVKMICSQCGEGSTEKEWKKNNDKTGKWVHKYPERIKNLGYQLSALASPFRNWESIIDEWTTIKGDVEKLKAFINTVLAETFEEQFSNKLDARKLLKRTREKYTYLPDKVLLLTCGVDVQDNRLELEIVGWGIGYESWGIKYEIIKGNMSQHEVWENLDRIINQDFYYQNGDKLKIYATVIDSGGHHTQDVYNYVSPRQNQMIIAAKGLGGDNVPIFNGFRLTKSKEVNLLSLGSNALKDIVISRLEARVSEEGYCHFNGERGAGYDLEYFKTLTAEVKVQENKRVVWKKIQERNEGFDCRCYATAPFYFSSINPEELSKLSREQLYQLSVNKELVNKNQELPKINNKGVEV